MSIIDRLKFIRLNCTINNHLNPHPPILEYIVKQITGLAKTNIRLIYLEDTVQLTCEIAENFQLIVTQNTIVNLIILCHKQFGLPVTETA